MSSGRGKRTDPPDPSTRALLDARDRGSFDADVLAEALANIDASQLAIEVRMRPLD